MINCGITKATDLYSKQILSKARAKPQALGFLRSYVMSHLLDFQIRIINVKRNSENLIISTEVSLPNVI